MKTLYSTPSLPKCFISIPFLAMMITQILFMCNVSSLNLTNTYLHHKCLVNQGIYKPGSVYEKELNSLIHSVSTTNFRDGFQHMSSGKRPNSVTIIHQCRGDAYWSKCRPCFTAGIAELRKRCPRNKGGIVWFDQCFVEITAIHVRDTKMEIDFVNIFSMHNPKMVRGDSKLFNKETMDLLQKLTLKANDKNNKDDDMIALYAAGEKRLETKTKLYAMVQCTRFAYMPDLCKVCLETIIKEYFPKCCDGSQGGRVLGTSCNFRYELYPFLRSNMTV